MEPLSSRPTNRGGGCSQMCCHKCTAGERICSKRTAGVESEPAYPQQTRPDKTEHHAVRFHRLLWIAHPLAYVESADQGGHSGGYMHHRTSRKIQCRETSSERSIQESAFAPYHVGHRIIDKERPEHHERKHRTEFHAFRKSPTDERRRNDGKHELVNHERLLRNRGSERGFRITTHSMQQDVVQSPNEAVAGAECEAVPTDCPKHGHHA